MSPVPNSLSPSTTVTGVGMWAKPFQTEYKNILNVLTNFLFFPTLAQEKTGKSTTRFNQGFIKKLTNLRVNKDSCGKVCTSALFNEVTFIAAIFLIVDQL